MVDDSSFVGISYRDRFHGDHLCSMGAFPTLVILDRQQMAIPSPAGFGTYMADFPGSYWPSIKGKLEIRLLPNFLSPSA